MRTRGYTKHFIYDMYIHTYIFLLISQSFWVGVSRILTLTWHKHRYNTWMRTYIHTSTHIYIYLHIFKWISYFCINEAWNVNHSDSLQIHKDRSFITWWICARILIHMYACMYTHLYKGIYICIFINEYRILFEKNSIFAYFKSKNKKYFHFH